MEKQTGYISQSHAAPGRKIVPITDAIEAQQRPLSSNMKNPIRCCHTSPGAKFFSPKHGCPENLGAEVGSTWSFTDGNEVVAIVDSAFDPSVSVLYFHILLRMKSESTLTTCHFIKEAPMTGDGAYVGSHEQTSKDGKYKVKVSIEAYLSGIGIQSLTTKPRLTLEKIGEWEQIVGKSFIATLRKSTHEYVVEQLIEQSKGLRLMDIGEDVLARRKSTPSILVTDVDLGDEIARMRSMSLTS
ncbi:hypothetical protein MKZ38_003032 [Zalerion maritima]|uniref:Uncharacterized protein n=1 Tax=Zalerion maritima TaxID=339359 RepID=A0AAD5RNU2_9PEZI|nr:hypothetical protein MKZ38_003032 [Zalerion maritima]